MNGPHAEGECSLMGAKARLFTPIHARSLDELVPADHFSRHVDRVLALSFVRDLAQDCYAAGMGRPSVDPRVFFTLQLVMFFADIRSERQLLRLTADRLSVRWFLGDHLDESLPDHSRLTRMRARYGLAVFRRFFPGDCRAMSAGGAGLGQRTLLRRDPGPSRCLPRFAHGALCRRGPRGA
jgi:transposase